MKIEAVVVCRDYADFLHYTLPWTKQAVDNLVIVTSEEDEETQRVCEFHDVRCLVTDAFEKYRGELNKGAAINEGLSTLDRNDWLLILDADILIPPHVRPFLESSALNTKSLYGVDRRNCDGKVILDEVTGGSWGFDHLPLLDRVSIYGGYPPVGYFQLFHSCEHGHAPWYDELYPYADKTDAVFAKSFNMRGYLKTWVVHLDNGGHVGGQNWKGRESPRFVTKAEVTLDLKKE